MTAAQLLYTDKPETNSETLQSEFRLVSNMDVVERSRNYDDSLMSYWLFTLDSQLDKYLDDIIALTTHISKDYIWQNETFCLTISKGTVCIAHCLIIRH